MTMNALPPVLSKWAKAQHRNVFLWSTYGNNICMSWRVDELNPITVKTMYRWLDAAKKETGHARGYEDYSDSIYPVDVKRDYEPLSYSIKQNAPRLPRDSKDVLLAGHYGVYEPHGTQHQNLALDNWQESFALNTTSLEELDPPLASFIALSSTLSDAAISRDQRCMLTGIAPAADDSLQVTWILPPQLYYLIAENSRKRNRLEMDIDNPETQRQICELAMIVENCLTMTKGLAVLFNENRIGIDLDDNHRIVCFDIRDEVTMSVKTYLMRPVNEHGSLRDDFLRAHFVRCLVVNTCNGDVSDQFPENAMQHFLEQVGYPENVEDLGLNEKEMAEIRAEWDTEIGQVIQSWISERGGTHGIGRDDDDLPGEDARQTLWYDIYSAQPCP
ncbi:hypothetical protein Hypma_012128 [Hypsizygus marmoreus]|uniref:Uncharacterized protein n=1 Tax=Hypsizygus marmoreus TaxID=39966 RepID=A0A369JFP2_HYPMA|nr:hypothetical protein Hypma_012128 [Hypsizygus marmoreus]